MFKLVKKIIEEELGVDPGDVTAEARLLEDLGADSLDALELLMAMEENFAIDITDEEAAKWTTVGDIVAYLEGVGAETT